MKSDNPGARAGRRRVNRVAGLRVAATITTDAVAEPDPIAAPSAAEPPADTAPAAGSAAGELTVDTAESSTVAADSRLSRLRARPRGTALPAGAALSLVLVVAAIASTVALYIGTHGDNDGDRRRTEYVDTARQAILNLTTIRADSAQADIDRILAGASGEFKSEFDGRLDPFREVVQQAQVVSTGEIIEAALEHDGDSSAVVLVAAKQTVTNAGQPEAQQRYYRFRVTVDRTDSGLTISKVEFVA
ncbi:hypothetical protein ACWIGI_36060 [Nocardia sp. NPDC055321]